MPLALYLRGLAVLITRDDMHSMYGKFAMLVAPLETAVCAFLTACLCRGDILALATLGRALSAVPIG